MQSVPGVADESLWALVTGPARSGAITGVLADAVHLDVDGVLVVVCGSTAVRLPGSVVVSSTLAHLVDLDDHASAAVGGGRVQLGTVAIEVRRWTPVPRPRLRDVPGASVRARKVTPRLPSLPSLLDCRTSDLQEALRTGGEGAVQAAVDGLIGLGPGLTPLGDDVLAGAALALHAAGEIQRHVLVSAIAARRHRTTAVSAALLDAAATGRCIPQAARFLAALDGQSDLESSLAALLAVGHTSGAALATGIVHALTLPPSDEEAA